MSSNKAASSIIDGADSRGGGVGSAGRNSGKRWRALLRSRARSSG
ncbi:hypothetical protein ACM6XU_004855 [Vibrio parahaemolyticus]